LSCWLCARFLRAAPRCCRSASICRRGHTAAARSAGGNPSSR
jgi:hypothetical protein